MSYTEHVRGKLIDLGLGHLTFLEAFEVLKEDHEILDIDIDDEYIDSPTLLYINNTFYGIEKEELADEFLYAKKTYTGYDFEVRYYNGGCGFHEALKEALKRIK
jgi:hypothetical protein